MEKRISIISEIMTKQWNSNCIADLIQICQVSWLIIIEKQVIVVSLSYVDLYRLDNQGQIIFNFEEISIEQSVSGCQFVFQKRFFIRYYMFFERDFDSAKSSLKISFNKISSSDFGGLNNFIIFFLIFIIILAILLAGYISSLGGFVTCRRTVP